MRLGILAGACLGATAAALGPGFAADLPLTTARAPQANAEPVASRFYIHVGPAALLTDEGASITAGGVPLAGATISLSPRPQYTAAMEVGYFLTSAIAVSLTMGYPPKADIKGAGTIAPLGKLGTGVFGPMALTAHYHFMELGRFQPYIGGGVTYLHVFDTSDGALSNLKINDRLGLTAQVGADIMIDDHWGAFIDVKKAYQRTSASGTLGGAPIRGKVTLDPWVFHTGLTYRF